MLFKAKCTSILTRLGKGTDTLKRDAIEENFEDLDDSSGSGGKSPATKGHLEAPNKSWCSGTT